MFDVFPTCCVCVAVNYQAQALIYGSSCLCVCLECQPGADATYFFFYSFCIECGGLLLINIASGHSSILRKTNKFKPNLEAMNSYYIHACCMRTLVRMYEYIIYLYYTIYRRKPNCSMYLWLCI